MSNEVVMYLVVNKDLEMSTGKIGSQVAHGAVGSTLKNLNSTDCLNWLKNGETIIILCAKEKELKKLVEHGFYPFYDEGRTEIEPNSLSVVALPPMEKSKAQAYVKRFQLLK